MSSFPTFTVNPQVFASYFAYQKMWHLDTTNKLTENGTLIGFKGGKNAGFPLVLTDVNATSALLISPGLNFPIATHVHHENFMDDSVVCGLSGTITSIPQGLCLCVCICAFVFVFVCICVSFLNYFNFRIFASHNDVGRLRSYRCCLQIRRLFIETNRKT